MTTVHYYLVVFLSSRSIWRRARERVLCFGRSAIVGSGGTALDFAALTISIHLLGLNATWSRVVGLVVGAALLFWGSRSYAFRASSEAAAPQATRFVLSEAVGFPLNLVAFKLLVGWLPSVPPEALSLVANFVLFCAYYYPVRSLIVFKTKPVVAPQPVAVPANYVTPTRVS